MLLNNVKVERYVFRFIFNADAYNTICYSRRRRVPAGIVVQKLAKRVGATATRRRRIHDERDAVWIQILCQRANDAMRVWFFVNDISA